ncbi:nuclear transport factor 2 family protein [Nocardia brasiliensis]|uniref:nuclear transport factor 2 family protein n=1 Tax=Nocardia brasiliensis TaxID=37326 RepID=UPI003D89FC12
MRSAAAEVFDEVIELLRDSDIAGFVELFADDAVIEFPFAPAGRPTRLDGRTALGEYMAAYPDTFDIRKLTTTAVYRTQSPEVVVAEFSAEGFLRATGNPYQAHYIVVMTVLDGRITRYRDYWNALAFQDTTYGGRTA